MSETAKDVNVIDDPAATRNVLGVVPFTDAMSLVKAMEWLLEAPPLFSWRIGERSWFPEMRFSTTNSKGVVQLIEFSRKPASEERVYGDGLPNVAIALVVADSPKQA